MAYRTLIKEEVREEIQARAMEMFLTRGIEKMEMKDLAVRVGISRSTLYRYYPYKEQLAFSAAIKVLNGYVVNLLNECLAENTTGYEKLSRYMHELTDDMCASPEKLKFLVEFDHIFTGDYPPFKESEEFTRINSQNMDSLTRLCKIGVSDGSLKPDTDPRRATAMLMNVIFGLTQRIVPRVNHINSEHGVESISLIREVVDCLLNSLRA